MSTIDPKLLLNIPLFSLLDDQELFVLAQHLEEKNFLAGQIILTAGEPGDSMFVVESGRVELFLQDSSNQRVHLSFVEQGELFGELSMLDKAPRSASAIALVNTHLLVVDREDLMLLVTSHPHAALDMLSMLGTRIREANALVHDRVTRNVNEEFAVQTLSVGERISDFLTALAGDIRFVYFSLIWFFVWIVWNTNLIPGLVPFDPFPFGLLTMVVSLEAIFLSLFVLISQNRGAAREKVRNDIEYDVNLKAEIEVREIMKQIDNLQQLMLQHLSAIQTGKIDEKPQLASVKKAGGS